MANKTDGIIITPRFTTLFPNLFEPRAFMKDGKETGEKKYSLVMLFDPDDVKDLKTKALEVAKAKWGSKDGVKFPFKRGDDEKEKAEARDKNGDFYEDKVVMKASSKFEPGVVGKNKQEILNSGEVYSGCIGRAELNFVATEVSGNKYVSAYVNFYMKVADGERIAGRSAKDVFADVEGGESDYDPSSDLDDYDPSSVIDDEIPF